MKSLATKNWHATSKILHPHSGKLVRLVERKRKWNNNFNDLRGVKNSRFLSPLLYYVPLKNKVMRVESDTLYDPFIQKILHKLAIHPNHSHPKIALLRMANFARPFE